MKKQDSVIIDEPKIKCFELDFGDTNLIVEDIQAIFDWIKAEIDDINEEGDIYTIRIKYLTRTEINNLPEWS